MLGYIELSQLDEQVSQLQNLVQALSATKYGFKTSLWKKDKDQDNIDAFFKALKENGPMMVPGKFGKSYYVDPAGEASDIIFGKTVFGWAPNSAKKEVSRSHIVIIIGVIKQENTNNTNGGGYVYYMDPNDPSGPLSPQADKIYKMSYITH